MSGLILFGDNAIALAALENESVNLIYTDPPFNTGKTQKRTFIKTEQDEDGDRTGFQGKRYKTTVTSSAQYPDKYDDYIHFLAPRIREAYRVLKDDGSLFLHVDPRESHYCKVMLDEIFGRDSFMNEIIWSFDYGGRSRRRWSQKHNSIFWYAKNPKSYTFNYDAIDRIPYMAPKLAGAEKAKRGKTPTDVWWHTIVSPTGKEKVGYPTQKPLGVIERIVKVHSNEGDVLLDFFAGSGTLGVAAEKHNRSWVLIDNNWSAFTIMADRLFEYEPILGTVFTNESLIYQEFQE